MIFAIVDADGGASVIDFSLKGQNKGRTGSSSPICAESGAIVVTSLLEPAPFIIHGARVGGGGPGGGRVLAAVPRPIRMFRPTAGARPPSTPNSQLTDRRHNTRFPN